MTDEHALNVNEADPDDDDNEPGALGAEAGVVEPGLPAGDDPGDEDPDADTTNEAESESLDLEGTEG